MCAALFVVKFSSLPATSPCHSEPAIILRRQRAASSFSAERIAFRRFLF